VSVMRGSFPRALPQPSLAECLRSCVHVAVDAGSSVNGPMDVM
jgi:hypothetical protein